MCSSVSNVPQQYKQPLQTGDLPSGSHIELRKSDGATAVPVQQDGCSTWAQDGSCKAVNLNFTEPDPISSGGGYVTYFGYAVPGAPANTPSVSKENITAGTNFCIKSTDLSQADGTPETGTWDFICLNNVLNSHPRFNEKTGYGPNPAGGWEYYAQGPKAVGIHAFQYARREGDNATHKWLRTDMWVEFRGTGANPCPCKVSALVTLPNTYGPLTGGTVGPAVEPGYVYSVTLFNGATPMHSWGGAGDERTAARLSPDSFNTGSGNVTLPKGNAYEKTIGIFPVKLTSTGTCPGGLTCGSIYYINMPGENPFVSADQSQFWTAQCQLTWCKKPAVALTNGGSGTITLTPYIVTSPMSGSALLDAASQPIWTDASGAVTPAPATLLAQDFNYLTQKTKATPPFITAVWEKMQPVKQVFTYFPGSYFYSYDLNMTGDGPGDERIGYFPHSSAIALFQPSSANAAQNSRAFAASWSRQHMYHMDETVGQPVVLNNGHLKNGITYPALGRVNPNARTFPYNKTNNPAWLTPSANDVDKDPVGERYGVWVEASHLPAPQMEVLLRSGDPLWQFTLVQQAQAVVGWFQYTFTPFGGTNYYRVFSAQSQQTRGIGWGGRVWDQADYFEPATSAISQYLHDIEKDNADWLYLSHVTPGAVSPKLAALGYLSNDTNPGSHYFQWWQDDFAWLEMGIMAWRNEYPNYRNFTNKYFHKQIIGRMDSSVGGCLWAGPIRFVMPYTGNTWARDQTGLAQSWAELFANTQYNSQLEASVQGSINGSVLTVTALHYNGWMGGSASSHNPQPIRKGATVYSAKAPIGTITSLGTGTGGAGTYNLSDGGTVGDSQIDIALANPGWSLPPYWTGCPTSGFWEDVGGSKVSTPNGLVSFAVGSLGIGAVLGIPNAEALYAAGRKIQYAAGFSCNAWNAGRGVLISVPEFCYGPLGTEQ